MVEHDQKKKIWKSNVKFMVAVLVFGVIVGGEPAAVGRAEETTVLDGVRRWLEALRRNSKEPRSDFTMAAVRALRLYGADARTALPDLIAGFDRLEAIPKHEFATEEVGEYLATMAAIAPADSAVIQRILDHLAPDHPLNHSEKPYRPVAPLAWAVLARIGVPSDPAFHKIAVTRLSEALSDASLASLAILVLEKSESKLIASDSALFVPLLIKIVKTAQPKDNAEDSMERIGLRPSAIRVLARFGTNAKEAFPILKQLSERPRLTVSYNILYLEENTITEEARIALTAISPP